MLKSYIKYKDYHDEKAMANPLKVHDYCLVLNPKLDTQRQVLDKSLPKWMATYRAEKKYTNENYLVRKCGTLLTQGCAPHPSKALHPTLRGPGLG